MTATTDGICHSYVTDRESEYSQLLEETITTENGILPEMETGRKTYLYGNGLLAMKRDETPEIWYYHYNNTGSTTEVTDQSGKIVYRISYGTYGELRGITGSDGQNITESDNRNDTVSALRFLYNGQLGVETEENGIYYMRARYYNPQIKRFISRDPLEGDITDSRTLNRYSYVLGNPVSLTDPFGLCAEEYYSNKGHEALDILGFVFDPADAANTIWYVAEGNYKMAGINLIAVIPIAGSGISKAGKEAAEEATEKAAIKAMREGAEEATEKATKEAAEKYARENAQKYAKKNATQNAAKSADDAAKAAGKMGKTSYGKSSGKYDTTADFLTIIENRNGKFYTDKATIDKIGQIEARGEDFSLLNKRIMSSRASTEGGTSIVYKYSDELGTKYLLHEVTDARGYIIHRDFDAVRISSGQLINKSH